MKARPCRWVLRHPKHYFANSRFNTSSTDRLPGGVTAVCDAVPRDLARLIYPDVCGGLDRLGAGSEDRSEAGEVRGGNRFRVGRVTGRVSRETGCAVKRCWSTAGVTRPGTGSFHPVHRSEKVDAGADPPDARGRRTQEATTKGRLAMSLITPELFSEVADSVTCNGYGCCVQPEMERGRSPLVSIPPFGRGFPRHRYDHQAIPQHGCVPAEPASVSPGKIIVAPPRPSVSTSGYAVRTKPPGGERCA